MSIKKNYIYNTLLQISSILFPLITFPYVSRVIGPEGTGKISFIMSVVQYFVLIAAIGIPMYGAREIARIRDNKEKLDRLFSELLSINMINSLVLSGLYILMLIFVPKVQTDFTYFAYAIFFVLLGFTNVDWFFSGIENFKLITIRSLVVRVISIVCLFLFVHNKEDFNVFYALSFLGLFASNFINIYSLRGKVQFTFLPAYKKHIKALLMLFSTVFAISIYTLLDITLLGFLTDDVYVGYYNAAVRLNKIAIPTVISLGMVMLPRMSNLVSAGKYDDYNRLVMDSFSFVSFATIPISLFLFLFARDIILVATGSQYLPAVSSMKIMSPLIILIGFSHVFANQILTVMRYDKIVSLIYLFGALFAFLLYLLLIPKLKHNGAAITTVLSEFVLTILLMFYALKFYNIRFSLKYIYQALLAIAPMTVLNLFPITNPLERIMCAGGVGLILYIVVQYFFKNRWVLFIKNFI